MAYKQKGFASAFADVVKRYKDSNETTTNEVNNLKALTTKLRAGFIKKGTRVKRAKPTRRKYKIKDVLGKPDIKDLEKRDRIYSYWEGVDKKYKKVQSTLKSLLKHGNAANYEDSMQKKLDKLESVSKVGSLEYVVKVEPQGLVLTPSDIRAFELVKQYLIERGLDEKEEQL